MEYRELEDGTVHIEGYCNAICRDSKELNSPKGKFVEQVCVRTWDKALRNNDDVKLLFNHISTRTLGSVKQGNVKLYEDAIGLHISADIKDEEVRAKKDSITGFSFGFSTNKDRWEKLSNNVQRRYLEDINLYEVSVLTVTPAYDGTLAEVRSEDSESIEFRFIEDKQNEIEEIRKENSKIDMSSVYETELFITKNKNI